MEILYTLYSHRKLFNEKLIIWKILQLLVWTFPFIFIWKAALSRPRPSRLIFFQKSFSKVFAAYQWKLPNSHIHKKGSMKLRSYLRPVSPTSILCQIFKIILTKVMHGNLKLNKPISIEQHGFVSFKAYVTNLLESLDLTTNALHKHRKLEFFTSTSWRHSIKFLILNLCKSSEPMILVLDWSTGSVSFWLLECNV